jgi:alpha-beta hydrolase superfamily lysophospholipase
VQPEWVDDVLAGYQQATLPLGADPDGEGELFATLVRTADSTPSSSVVLAVHGYTDYFFNTELADHFAARGWRFYALDSHRCGRSWREGQTPHFTTDLARYDRELEWAMSVIAAENPGAARPATSDPGAARPATSDPGAARPATSDTAARVLVCGHSTGGLVVALWLDRVRQRGATEAMGIAGLVLNSPFLDLNGPAILRTKVTSTAIGAVSKVRKTRVLRGSGTGGYGLTLHREYHGEFDYNLRWKPLGGFPITVGWIHAIRRGQARLHRGLDVGVPNLVLRSDHSVAETAETDMLQRGDAVLDVAHIARWAGCLGNRTTSVPVKDAKHDVFLSLTEPRAAAYAELDRWLDDL